jgi:hypothetical protein
MGNICFRERKKDYLSASDAKINAELCAAALPIRSPTTVFSSLKPSHVALFDYETATVEDITIKTNDPLLVLNQRFVKLYFSVQHYFILTS